MTRPMPNEYSNGLLNAAAEEQRRLNPFSHPPASYNAQEANCCDQQAQTAGSPYRPPTLREEAEKSVGYHREQADRHDRAVAFFRENPAFDEFIRLIRAGVIQI